MIWDVFKKAFKKEEEKQEQPQAPKPQQVAKTSAAVAEPAPAPAQAKAPQAQDKQQPAEIDEKELEKQMDEEFSKLAPGMLAQIKDPKIRQKILDLAKKMIKSGVDLKSEKQIKNWLKTHPEEIQQPSADGQPQKVETFRREMPKVGRNDACPCGSGKKYKKCCGKSAE
jgi:uncharacterized protein YecA (UPF0149 family)